MAPPGARTMPGPQMTFNKYLSREQLNQSGAAPRAWGSFEPTSEYGERQDVETREDVSRKV